MEIRSTSNKHQLQAIIKGKELVKHTYIFCNEWLPEKEKYGLWSQMTRCAVSIPSNLAEGQQRGDKEFLHFVKIARGSLEELRVQIDLCRDIGYCGVGETMVVENLLDEVGKLTYRLMLRLEADAYKGGAR